jgi:hypothetical protein
MNTPGPLDNGDPVIKQEPEYFSDHHFLSGPHSDYEPNMEAPLEKNEVQHTKKDAKKGTKKRKAGPEQPTDEKEPAKPSKKRVAKACNKCHIDHVIDPMTTPITSRSSF